MKWVRFIVLGLLIALSTTATAQRRLLDIDEPGRLRLRDLNLTVEQKRRLIQLIQRERRQRYLNQLELNDILTDKQKLILLNRKSGRSENKNDSTGVKP